MQDTAEADQGVTVANQDHARGIWDVYRSVQIDPQLFLDLVSPSSERAAAARSFLHDHGGFLCPPVDDDMAMALRDGVTFVCVKEGEVVGFNRIATDPQVVFRSFCEEFRLDPSIDHSDGDRLPDWSGRVALNGYRTLTRVVWLDRGLASVAFKSAKAGVNGAVRGKLAWAIDSAVTAPYQRSGIGSTLSRRLRETLKEVGFGWVAYRMFEIQSINGSELVIHNDPSRKAFTASTSRHFAYTEEDIRLRDDTLATVRWNHWLKQY